MYSKSFWRIAAACTSSVGTGMFAFKNMKEKNGDVNNDLRRFSKAQYWSFNHSASLMRMLNAAVPSEALIDDPEDYKRLHSTNTNAYVWGEGI